MSVVYFVQAGAGGPIKIGVASDLAKRITALQTGCPDLLVVLAVMEGGQSLELRYHRLLRAHRMRGEWFRPAPKVLEAIALAKEGRMPEAAASVPAAYYSPLRNLVALIRLEARRHGAKRRMADIGGLHHNTLLGCEDETWNPTLSTLLALERHVVLSEAEIAA